MKTTKFFAFLLAGIVAVACNNAATEETVAVEAEGEQAPAKVMTAKDYLPTSKETKDVSYLLGINFGSFIKNYDFGEDLNYAEITKGIKDFLKAEGDVNSVEFGEQFRVDPNSMNDVFNSYLENRQQYTSLINKEKESKYLEENGKKEGVVTTESGLQYKIIEPGNDVRANLDDTVTVYYKGTLLDGTVFDEVAEDEEPISFMLGQVIKGWQEGMQLVGEGGKIQLAIPYELGYGTQSRPGMPACSTLLFDVTLVKIEKAAPAEE